MMAAGDDEELEALLREVAASPKVIPEVRLAPGDVAGGRFLVREQVAGGGMGRIYRAVDQTSGHGVALKLLLHATATARRRFAREAKVLAELSHPNIVGYVAHGETRSGAPFLAMNWIDGEDLERRLARGPLGVAEAVSLVTKITEAVAVAHRRGITHRDIKPSNVLLDAGDLARPTLADFGLASFVSGSTLMLTGSDEIVGTPSYMAPEQARGDRVVDARADVFALGALLFECLVGRPAFSGQHIRAVLAKVLFEETPRVSWQRHDVAPALDALIAAMLEKEAARRPRDADDVLARFAALGDFEGAGPAATTPRLGDEALRWTYVVMAAPARDAIALAATHASASPAPEAAFLQALALRHGAELQVLADGTIFLRLERRGSMSARSAADGAMIAARCAIELARRFDDLRVSLGALRSHSTGTMRVGDLLERVATQTARVGKVTVDKELASLLDVRFRVRPNDAGALELEGEDEGTPQARLLLGKATPLVGRERELVSLRAMLTEVADEGVARVSLITAGPGVGKTRLQQEVVSAAEGFAIWFARADMMRAGLSLYLLARLVRNACGVREADDGEARYRAIASRVRTYGCEEPELVADFLGEVSGAPRETPGAALLAARQDALAMAKGVRLAWERFVGGATARGPVLIVLDDIHWGDAPTLDLVAVALQRCRDRALAVLALGRPETLDLFPRLWADRQVTHMPLAELSPRARARLVHHVLGADAAPDTVAKISELSAGNAFYLEELIRVAALGTGAELPLSVVAMVEARLDGLPVAARRLLHLASVFGEVFWLEGVRALLPVEERAPAKELAAELTARELLTASDSSRFAGQAELAFRHALVREAAYASLSTADRRAAHEIAAEWLVSAGERDAFVLADHFERAGQAHRASEHYAVAAAGAMRASDWKTALRFAARGTALQNDARVLGRLAALEAEVLAWTGEVGAAADAAQRSVTALRTAAVPTVAMIGELGWAMMLRGMRHGAGAIDEVRHAALEIASSVNQGWERFDFQRTAAFTTTILYFGGDRDAATALATAVGAYEPNDPRAQGWHAFTRVLMERFATGNTWAALRYGRVGVSCFARAGDAVGLSHMETQAAIDEMSLGAHERADEHAKRALAISEQFGTRLMLVMPYGMSALAAASLGRIAEARALVELTATTGRALGDSIYGCYSVGLAACAARFNRDYDQAIELASWAFENAALVGTKLHAQTQLAAALLASGQTEAALAKCLAAIELARTRVRRGALDLDLWATSISAMRQLGHEVEADVVAERARALMRSRADSIDDPAARSAFLATPWANVISP